MRKILVGLGIAVAIVTGSAATAQAESEGPGCVHYKDRPCDMSWTEETEARPT